MLRIEGGSALTSARGRQSTPPSGGVVGDGLFKLTRGEIGITLAELAHGAVNGLLIPACGSGVVDDYLRELAVGIGDELDELL